MNNIVNLINKEFIFIKGSMKMQLIICLIFIVVLPFVNPTLTYVSGIIIPYFLVYGTMAFEERSKGEVLSATLPVSRREICLSKYLLGILYSIISGLISVVFMKIGIQFVPSEVHQNFQGIAFLPIAGLIIFVGIIYTGLMIPIILKYGTEKSRFVMLFLYLLGFIAMNSIGNRLIMGIGALSNTILYIGAVILYALSIIISLKIYEKKEFR